MQLLITIFLLLTAPQWSMQTSGVTSRLRGVSAVNEKVAWTSGANNTILRTTDGGITWKKLTLTTDKLDFRDIDAIDANTCYVMSIGNGSASRIYKTTNGGESWDLQFKSDDPKVFLDAMSFWDASHGIAFGDSVNGQFYILITENGGRVWSRVPVTALPPALRNEGAFAASGTNIAVVGKTRAWIGTGASDHARVLFTTDRGRSWRVVDTPLAAGPSAGIFSVAFRDSLNGVVVGGDYKKETEAGDNLAITRDGGSSWTLTKGLTGFRSVVAYLSISATSKSIIAIGPAGADLSTNDGQTWIRLDGPGFDTFSFARQQKVGWASGAGGQIGKLTFVEK